MVNHSLGRKPNVLFMPSFELKCFSLCYINIYITPSNRVIDSVRSLWEHIPCYSGKGRTMQEQQQWVRSCADTAPDLFPSLQLPGELHRAPGVVQTLPARWSTAREASRMSCELHLCHLYSARSQQVLQKATSTRMLRAGTELLLTSEGMRTSLEANLTRILSHFVFTRWCSWRLSWAKRFWAQHSNESTSAFLLANTVCMTAALSEVWL